MAKYLIVVFIMIFISCLGVVGEPAKYALLIGISDYSLSGLASLQGPGNDIFLIKRVLQDKFKFQEKDITILMNKRATHTRVEEAFTRLSQIVKKGDFIYIHYCGHGSQVLDKSGDEYPGAFDQTWVPYGSRSRRMEGKDGFDIIDDELRLWLLPIFNKTANVVLVSDSCYSGSIARGDVLVTRSVLMDTRDYSFLSGFGFYSTQDLEGSIVIGAARDEGLAFEASFDGEIHGLFSWYWANALLQTQPGDSWGYIFNRTSTMVTRHFEGQHPQFHGDPSKPVFGIDSQ